MANVALWGGLVILGRAPTNLANGCGVGNGMGTVEGLDRPRLPAGGCDLRRRPAARQLRRVRFVSIRHAGDEIGASNELNGLTLGGVGDGTIFEYIEVYVNFDDGFEWFGGTVNGNNLAVLFVGDDMFDLDEGYTGVNQFLFGIMPFFNQNGGGLRQPSGDKAGEFDGDDFAEVGAVEREPLGPPSIVAHLQPAPWPMSHRSSTT